MNRSLIALGAACLLLPSAQATLLNSDGFNYTPGGNLYPNGNWNGADGVNTSEITVGNGSLSYPGLATLSGNEASVAGNQNIVGANTAITFASQSSGTVYVSFLLDVTSLAGGTGGNNQNYGMAGMVPSTQTSYASSQDPCGIAIKTAGGGNTGGYLLEARSTTSSSSNANSGTQGYTLMPNQTELVVLKWDFGSKVESLYVNPSSSTFGGTDPGTPSVTQSGGTPANLAQFYLRDGGNTLGTASESAPYLVGDVLIGTSWADVTPVAAPEPVSSVLIGFGVLGLAISRRMRRA
jgi:hypothetical protein